MEPKDTSSLVAHISVLRDSRVDRTKLHSLTDMLVIAICAVICDMDSWVDVELFGQCKEQWFRTFLKLPNGIPSHDTFGRVFSLLDPEALSRCLGGWLSALSREFTGQIAIDGKTMRGSFDRAAGQSPLHLVSAYAAEARLTLGEVATEAKSNEITAIPELLKVLFLKGCIVSIDAMGCQREIARQIVEQEGDYVLGLKGNQTTMHAEVKEFFEAARSDDFEGVPHSFYEEVDKGHGRVETRKCWATSDVQWFEDLAKWPGLRSFVAVESTRVLGDQTSTEMRYFISSLDGKDAGKLARAIRQHWAVENELHWVLDVVFHEDLSRVRDRNAAHNFSILRRFALNLLKQTPYRKASIRGSRKAASLDENYLLRVLTGWRAEG